MVQSESKEGSEELPIVESGVKEVLDTGELRWPNM